MIPSAPCDPTTDLLSEIGPPADLPVEMLLCLSQPRGTLNENRTPFSVTVSLDAHINDATGAHAAATRESEARPTLKAVGEEPGCAQAEDEGQCSVMPATTTTVAAVAPITALAALFMFANLRIVLLPCRIAARAVGETMRCGGDCASKSAVAHDVAQDDLTPACPRYLVPPEWRGSGRERPVVGVRFVARGDGDQGRLCEGSSHQFEADWEAARGEAGRYNHGGKATERG